ncbi:hypothetical protein MES4922_170039 [Mesorhizobium ventifaucium]|uniref:Uncharacterized protein n=1 Tax=Mesorhizobium ventifaucium TaxID=666020 RepID=A0ABN8JEP3_9HYPH|nr:hypothetical protein MES4922_170039 [Mesorhizobium ventifaucium]
MPVAGRCNATVALTVVFSGLVTHPLSAVLGMVDSMGYDSAKIPASNHVARIDVVGRILLIVHYFSCA